MSDINTLKLNIIDYIKQLDCRPDTVNFPNGAEPKVKAPYVDVSFPSVFTSGRFAGGEAERTMLLQFDVYVDVETGIAQLDEITSGLVEAFRNHNLGKIHIADDKREIDLTQITATDLPDVNELGLRGGKYSTAVSVFLKYVI